MSINPGIDVMAISRHALLRRRHKVRSRGSRPFSIGNVFEDRKVFKLGRQRGGPLHAFV
jgi:hypothetical protein